MVDVSSVTAVTAAPAQSAAAPVTIDTMFAALLQSVTDSEGAALAAPSVQAIQGAALALVLPASSPTGQQASEQQDNVTAAPGSQTPQLFAPVAPATQSATSEQLPAFPAPDGQLSTNPQIKQRAPALPQTSDAAIQTSETATDIGNASPSPIAVPAPELVSSIQPSAPQEATAPQDVTPPQAPRSGPPVEQPLPAALAPEPAQVPVQTTPQTASPQSGSSQTASSQTTSSQTQAPTTPSVVDQLVTPAPRDPAPVTAKSAAPKMKAAAEPQPESTKTDSTTNTNTIVDVLAGFLLPQIEPSATPANDATADTVDPAASAKNDDQATPAVAATNQNTAAPSQPMPVAVVQPPPVPASAPMQTEPQIAPAAVAQTPAPKNNASADETPTVAQKPATRQQASHQTASERSNSQPVFVPANDTAPEAKPEPLPQAAANTHTASVTDTPQPAPVPASNPAPHQAPVVVANPAVPPLAAPSGLRKLTAGLQVAMQEQETTSSIDKLGLTIATKSIDGLRHFDIRLDPPELGRVQVQLTTDDAGRSQANVVVDKPQTLELLQRDAQNLNRALNDAGLNVSNNGLNFSLREQYRQNDGGVDQGRGRSLSVQAVVQTDATHIHSSLGSYAPNSVRLDIRV